MRRLVLLSLVAAPLGLGCSSSSPAGSVAERTGEGRQQIFYGKADNTHDAVVAILSKKAANGGMGWACTGTIVAKNGGTGYVLTAAHCVNDNADPPAYVILGPDYSTSQTAFPVTNYKADPQYDAQSSSHDFGMMTISGVGAQTPTIPVMTPAQDNLKVGSTVRFVGYGRTENNDQNSKRFYVDGKLQDVYALTVDYSQQNGGPCEGDSGGPSLSTVGGQEVVSTVTSSGDQTCTQYGLSGRASAVWDTFINPYITGGQGGQQTCDQCFQSATQGQGACVNEVQACLNDADCKAMVQCFQNCAQGDQNCVNDCAKQHQAGVAIYNKIGDCVCTTGCKTECGGEAFCQQAPPPKCGFTAQDANCQSCFEGACCSQATACANDAACSSCVTSQNPDPSCGSNQLAKDFQGCLQQSCASQCGGGGGGGQGGGGPINPGGGGSGQTTGTGTGTGTEPGGIGGAGQGGGAATGTGNGNGNGSTSNANNSNDPGLQQNSGCSVGGAPSSDSPFGAFALAALGLAGMVSRRRK
jgi:MYXO-CTERM domain-containing protein